MLQEIQGFTARSPQDSPRAEEATIELTEQTYAMWRDYILPQASELRWQQIAWRSSVATGLEEAQRQQKPLLLWIMNGHPLGNC